MASSLIGESSVNVKKLVRPLLPHFVKCLYQHRVLSRKQPEPDALRCRSFVKPGDSVVDIGANIGAYTKLLSEWVGPEGEVFAFEPIPETFGYLRHNAKRLEFNNAIVCNAGLSSYSGKGRMVVPDGNFYLAEISDRGQEVDLIRLDDVFRQRKIAFIKCDVEGHEMEVIEGALQLIQRDHPVWLMETRNDAVVQRMTSLGYRAKKLKHDWMFCCPQDAEVSL
jgi:FkbM family methyltransferase